MLDCCLEAAPAARAALPVSRSPARTPSMSDADVTALPVPPNGGSGPRPRIKKLRLLGILLPLGALAIVSTVFGMMMAVASDLPSLTAAQQLRHARNSVLYDVRGKKLGILTSNENRVLVPYTDIASSMKFAVIAIEDKRFFNNSGVDIRGIGRAFVQDLIQKRSAQGGPRSPSSSSRTRCRPRAIARSSRSCGRRRWPTTSRGSGPRRTS